MIRRIVKMSFDPAKTGDFKKVYEANWQFIRTFEGCAHVELLQDKNNPSIFFTYSHWKSEQHLENYRASELFKKIWAATKVNFNTRAEAWTVQQITFDQ